MQMWTSAIKAEKVALSQDLNGKYLSALLIVIKCITFQVQMFLCSKEIWIKLFNIISYQNVKGKRPLPKGLKTEVF